MPNLKTLGLLAALPGLVLAIPVPVSAQGTTNDAKLCKVTVDRSQPSGTYDVQRQQLENGDCICYVYTGPQPQSDTIEGSIANLLASRSCPDARQVAVPAAAGAAAAVGGGLGGVGLGLAGLGAAGAVAAAASGGSDGPNSP